MVVELKVVLEAIVKVILRQVVLDGIFFFWMEVTGRSGAVQHSREIFRRIIGFSLVS